jgi:hypothetical protein
VVVFKTASAEGLLVTAVVRRHYGVVGLLTHVPAVRRNVRAATLSIVLEHLLLADGGTRISRYFALVAVKDMIVDQQLPSQQLDISTVARLLRAVIQTQNDDAAADAISVQQLCKLVRGDERQQLRDAFIEACADLRRP